MSKELEPIQDKKGKYTLVKGFFKDNQLLRILQRTPRQHIYTRPGKGGGNWEFVTGTYVEKVLNYVFGWNWDFEIKSEEEKHGQIVVLGKLTVRDDKGNAVIKEQYGRADIKYKRGTQIAMDYGNDKKASATDAMKKCASKLGIASDIYGKNEFKDIAPEPVAEKKVAKTVDLAQKLKEAQDSPKEEETK